MKCRDCAYGKEDFNSRMALYFICQKNDKDCNILKNYPSTDDYADEIEKFLWCDKVGGKVYNCGHCTEWYESNQQRNICNQEKRKRKNKRERDEKYKQHLIFLAEHLNSYPEPAHYKDRVYDKELGFIDNPKPYYKRLYRANHPKGTFGYYKKYCNRVVRRYKGEIHKGGSFKKIKYYWNQII